jgi:hypothetical protein
VVADNGLSGTDRDTFYHLPEGSELYPYSWMKALYTEKNQPFIDNLERFGLMPDPSPNNTYGLPIGLTVSVRRGIPFAEMVGVNCAGCHVGALSYKGSTFVVDGSQNLFDLVGFYQGLIDSSVDTVSKPAKLWEFLVRWWRVGSKGVVSDRDSAVTTYHLPTPPMPSDVTRALFETYTTIEDLDKAGELESALADEVRSMVGRVRTTHQQQPAFGTEKQAPMSRPTISREDVAKSKTLSTKQPAPGGVFATSPTGAERQARVSRVLGDIGEYVRLFWSYVDFLRLLSSSSVEGTKPGFGRVDAFGGARNLLFPSSARPTTGPVRYPFLWGFGRIAYFHYMANTNSILQRNIGQALGVGATYEKQTHGTTVDIRNLDTLEQLAWRLSPPRWPTSIFGEVDAAKAARGKVLYEQNCADCHEKFNRTPPPNNFWDLNTYAVGDIGTDPNAANNFCVPLTYEGKNMLFSDAAPILLSRIEQRYYQDFNIPQQQQVEWNHGRLPVEWRCILKYPARPMAGIWATPPYLHNGSVLTIYDLLLQAKERPTTFNVGTREYDPVRLGYINLVDPNRSFTFDTTQPGNSNLGHEYGTNLSEEQKMDLIEYLKIHELPLY